MTYTIDTQSYGGISLILQNGVRVAQVTKLGSGGFQTIIYSTGEFITFETEAQALAHAFSSL